MEFVKPKVAENTVLISAPKKRIWKFKYDPNELSCADIVDFGLFNFLRIYVRSQRTRCGAACRVVVAAYRKTP